jgi:hypothetical protein
MILGVSFRREFRGGSKFQFERDGVGGEGFVLVPMGIQDVLYKIKER